MPSFQSGYEPPDSNGDVGPNHYVQQVNQMMTVFDKSGHVLSGPSAQPFSGFWGGQGLCATSNKGDPLVRYDRIADRWLVSQLAGGPPPGQPTYFLCVAISQTGDPTGGYYRYAFGPYTVGSTPALNDYPKLALWPDGYYATFNMYDAAQNFLGAKLCAFDRAQMLAGNAATQLCFQLFGGQQAGYGGALPSDWDGPFPPPPNSPNFIFADDNTPVGAVGGSGPVLQLWRFHVDWMTPANSTLTNVPANCPNGLQPPCPELIRVSAFNLPCDNAASGNLTCVPQKGQAQLLNTLGDRLMHRLVYRNFPGPGGYESIVISRSVDPGRNLPTGIRWYELRNAPGQTMANAVPVVTQQSTYAPADGIWRWMGSMAQDHVGNMALGFSASSTALNPSIYLAGRQSSDPLSTLPQSEAIVTPAASGSQTDPQWGDYSMMAVDPTDDCTFWYTNEFLKQDGQRIWDTSVVSLKFPNCSITEGRYSFSGLPSRVTAGDPFSFIIQKLNADGTLDSTYSGTANFTSTDGQAVLPGSVTFSGGVAVNVPATLKAEGFRTISATDHSTPTLVGYGNTIVTVTAQVSRPTITVTAPAANVKVSGTVDISATGTVDPSTTLSRIDLLVDTAVIASSTSLSATAQWDSTAASNGSHSVTARIVDNAGNTVPSQLVPIVVENGRSRSSGCQSVAVGEDSSFVWYALLFAAWLLRRPQAWPAACGR